MFYTKLTFCFNFALLTCSKRGESKQDKDKRVCRGGAGIEQHAFMKDTKGFPKLSKPRICRDMRGFRRLDLRRNHPRVLQSSLYCVRSWRANCDVQILLYESDPMFPSAEDIAKATDYIVGYACKGNENLKTEKKHMSEIIVKANEVNGDNSDVTRTARKILNYTIGEKMISKQEAMVQLGRLRLFHCSETIETHSLSGFYKLHQGRSHASTSLLQHYVSRPKALKDMTLYDFYYHCKRNPEKARDVCIPHFVGCAKPVFPITEAYAESMLMLYVPWTSQTQYKGNEAKFRLEELLKLDECPIQVKIGFERAKSRNKRKDGAPEPVANDSYTYDYQDGNGIPDSLKEAIQIAGVLPNQNNAAYAELPDLDFGLDYTWDVPTYKVS